MNTGMAPGPYEVYAEMILASGTLELEYYLKFAREH